MDDIKHLESVSNRLRQLQIEMLHAIGMEHKGHPGPALSITDIITALYFKVMKIDPANPRWEDRDRFILSKGHACPALYTALAEKGYFDKKHLATFRHVDSMLQGHPDMKKTPGIDMTAGSLGHGLGAGIGIALAARIDGKDYQTYVLVGDGETQEGLIWESAMSAGHYGLDNLTLIIDRNRWQSCSAVDCTIDIEPLADKLISFGWSVNEIDGHDFSQLIKALSAREESKPKAIIAKTIKGKGISFMEEDNSWHQRPITDDEFEKAMAELKAGEG
ncbi:MAG: transketolase [Candidatus Humimicrobiaceae bacterium]